jgi:murein L,D-transpeptidase YcbB/YkuD
MRSLLGAAATLVAAFALTVPAGANEPASAKVVSNEVKSETEAPAQPSSDATPAAEAQPVLQDPLAIALKARLAQAPKGESSRDRTDRTALISFYEARQYKPLWVSSAGLSSTAQSIIIEINSADDWGLKLSDFVLPTLAAGADDAMQANAEAQLSLAALEYARMARGGRLDPQSLTKFLDRAPSLLDPKEIITQISTVSDPGAWLRSQHPQHPQFERLRQKYLAMRQSSQGTASADKIPKGPRLEPGERHADIPLVRTRLKVAFTGPAADEILYDETLAEAVAKFQAERGVKARKGVIDAATRQALNNIEQGSPRRILANMEQWRWMPRDLGDYHVWVNVPEFMIRVVQNGRVIHSERIVVGKPDTQTPIFSHAMEQVIFHPFWGVPDSIKRNELQPSLAAGGAILARQGLRVQYRGRDIDPSSVDWQSADMRNFHIYQPPGPSNVLGVVKFRFPNKHDVYFHDTSQKHLFSASVRAFSHGCMRVQNPVRLAELILAQDRNMSSDRVRAMVAPGAPKDNQLNLTAKIPVHITYFTASVDDDGKVQYRNDLYGHEERIALGLEGKMHLITKVREPAPATRVKARPGYAPRSGSDWFSSIFNF